MASHLRTSHLRWDTDGLALVVTSARVVPILTLGAADYPTVYDTVKIEPDGAWWDV